MNIHPDIAAMMDVLDEMSESTDGLDVEQAVELRESIVELRRRAATVLGLVDTQLINTLESPREFDGQRYRIGMEGKWTPYHDKVTAAVKERAIVDTETGEFREAGPAVEEAIRLMRECYVAPATFPKTGALGKMGLEKSDVGFFEGKRPKLVVEAVAPKDDS